MADKMATQTYCKNIGGKGSAGNKLVTLSQLSTYGCKLISNPSKTYASNQCVAERDIMKETTKIPLNLHFTKSTKQFYIQRGNTVTIPSSSVIAIKGRLEFNASVSDYNFTLGLTLSDIKTSKSSWASLSGADYPVAWDIQSITPSTYGSYEFVKGILIED